ncbi:MAG: hypothetical protein H7122_16310 [Chitinophagaceae bacterium]|nr:hypothetical protein [Chitinophagaceae bacterium]
MYLLPLKRMTCLAALFFFYLPLIAQNLNGQKITVGVDAPAFIIFNAEVINVEWNSAEGSKYYNCKVRNNNSMSITFKGEDKSVPENIGVTVQEGKRNHYFIISLHKSYDINRDPPLWYDYKDLKDLKKYIQKQQTTNKEDLARLEKEENEKKQQDEAERQREVASTKMQQEAASVKRKQELAEKETQEKIQQQELEQQLMKAKDAEQKKEAERKQAEILAKKNEEERIKTEAASKKEEEKRKADDAIAKKKEEERIKTEETLTKKKQDDDRKKEEALTRKKEEEKRKTNEAIARMAEQDRAKALALAKAKAEEDRKKEEAAARAEAKRVEEEKKKADAIAKIKAEEDRKKKEELARLETKRKEEEKKKADAMAKARLDEERKKREHEEALARIKQLEEEKERKRKEKAYSRIGLWERYGSKGINVFDIPEKQFNIANADFFLTSDTLRNYNNSQAILKENPVLNVASEKSVNGGVSLVLESITFNAPNAYFKIRIINKSKEDFLMGFTGLYWYNEDGSPKKWLYCSYITYIQGFPIVPPGQETRIVLVTRDATIPDKDMLNINMSDRRPEKEQLNIIFDADVYNKERMKIEKKVTSEEPAIPKTETEPAPKSKKQKGKRNRKANESL